MVNNDTNILFEMYSKANEQVKLYAEFRWKAFSFLFTLNSGLIYIYLILKPNLYYEKFFICIIGIFLTVLLFFFEKRHRSLFKTSRIIAKDIEMIMINSLKESSLKVNIKGVFNNQIENKKFYQSHHFILKIVISFIFLLWTFFLFKIIFLY